MLILDLAASSLRRRILGQTDRIPNGGDEEALRKEISSNLPDLARSQKFTKFRSSSAADKFDGLFILIDDMPETEMWRTSQLSKRCYRSLANREPIWA